MTTTDAQPTGQVLFNPFDPAFRADPYPIFRRMREEEPVHQSPFGMLVLSRYDDCVAMLRDHRSSSDGQNSDDFKEAWQRGDVDADAMLMSTRPFLFMDPPDHTRLRGLVNKAFTPRVVEQLRPRIQQIVDECIAAAATKGEMDVIADLAYPLPVRIICEMLGVPPADHETFQGWSRDLASGLDPDFAVPQQVIDQRAGAADAFAEYFVHLVEQHREHPSDDLLSALIAAEDEGEKLTENELLATSILLLVAGHETTVNLIGNGALALLRHPGELQRLRDDPSLIRSAVEELLRYDPPVQLTARTALEDIVLGDATIPKGKLAVLLIGAANRDPKQFPDPERLDIGREDNRHIAFGLGIHFCLGAPLARVEGQIAIQALSQLRGLELAGEPVYKTNITLRGLATLPVRFAR